MTNGPDLSALARDMLKWEQKKRELDELGQAIKDTVMQIGKTQTVGNVRATYSKGRKTYDYQAAVRVAKVPEQILNVYSEIVYDWRKICDKAELEDIPFTEGKPSVSLKLLA